ncbi:Glutathione S-transferase DHAR2, partial [Tetrabaena socialis]
PRPLQVPSGLLPVIELDGRVVTESGVIMSLLEEQFPNHNPLMPPAGTPARARADGLMRLERRLFSDWLNWLCSDRGHERARQQFEATMDLVAAEMDREGGPFFLGSSLSLVDITFCPMLERSAASLAYYKGFYTRGKGRWPAVDRSAGTGGRA